MSHTQRISYHPRLNLPKISVEMKISHALLRLTILTHALSTTTTLANVPPVFDGYVETKSIKNHELDFLQVNNGTDLVLQECGVDNSDIESGNLKQSSCSLLSVQP
jgi:hypothetical protein